VSALPEAGTDPIGALLGRRPVHFRGLGFTDTPCYARGRLAPGVSFTGPAVVDQGDATTLIVPGIRARIDHAQNMILERS